MAIKVLIIDDEPSFGELLRDALSKAGFEVVAVADPRVALTMLDTVELDVVVTDVIMGEIDGNTICREAQSRRPDLPVIMMTSFGSLESAMSAIRAGADDFISKPFNVETLQHAIEHVVEKCALDKHLKHLREAVKTQTSFGPLIGDSAVMKNLYDMMSRVAETDASAVITGESGTGKELVAKGIHDRSKRCEGPFVAVNCAAMPESLLESELFGHTKGAFTDAASARTGLCVAASGGTLFLDEMGEMPLGTQVKLLRALQERTVRPIGSNVEVAFNTRIIAATNRDLDTEVARGRFREDLLYRINVIKVDVPPLRAREGDILLLAQCFLERFASQSSKGVVGFSRPVAERLLAHKWPGNVRELQNCIERAVAVTQMSHLRVDDLPERLCEKKPAVAAPEVEDPTAMMPLDEIERRYVLRVLEAVGGNKTVAAKVLKFDRKTLYRKLERYAYESSTAPTPTDA